MLSDCDLNINLLSTMQSGGFFPRLEAITKIADYLNCSVDYLLGRNEKENFCIYESSEDSLKQEFFKVFDALSFEEKVEIIELLLEKLKKNPPL
ncbi:MAG: hypothetical protein K2G88_05215 [Oscillospiraceae bacterium]|nr:hypothetical protein [Oscillospiraceae bacterium]